MLSVAKLNQSNICSASPKAMFNKVLVFSIASILLAYTSKVDGSCRPPTHGQNSHYFPKKSAYHMRSVVTYSCRKGCTMLGPLRRVCGVLGDGSYGWAPNFYPRCICPPAPAPTHYVPHPTTKQPRYFCSAPSAPHHGSVSAYPTKTQYSVGDRVTYRCSYGYSLVGDAVATCGHHGWSHVPRCQAIHRCPTPSSTRYGRIVSNGPLKSHYNNQEWVRYSCNPGYCMVGDATAYCRQSQWTHTPSCVAGCKRRSAPQYGFSDDTKSSWCPGDSTTYRCRYGYKMVGSSQSTCGHNQKWNKAVPSCKKVCGSASAPRYGRITSRAQTEYMEDQSYTISCNPGYCRSGDANVYCRHTGWSHSPVCNKGCGHRNPPSYGSYRGKSSGWCPGDRARFQCNSGFQMSGSEYARCGSKGLWDHSVPSCKKICPRPSNPRYGSIVSHPASKSRYLEDESITYRCNPGYCMSGNANAYCRHTGWTHAPTCRKACRHRNAPSYGSYYGSQTSWCPGQRARYRCNASFRMVGQEYSQCLNNGSWEHSVPVCKKICQRPSNPRYGYIVSTPRDRQQYNEDDSITYRCNTGYCLHGNAKAYCRHRGWTQPPICRPGCPTRDAPSYGSYVRSSAKYCPGQRAQFQCNTHFRLHGSEYSTCGPSGSWDSDVPRCRRVCGAPRSLRHGSTTSNKTSYSEGEYVDYTCNPGYCSYGDRRVYCRHNGFTDLPTCRKQCPHRNGPSYGSYVGSTTSWCPGRRARYQCNPTFRMVGQEYSRCQTDGTWEYDVPVCRKICQRPSNPRYGYIVSSPRDKQQYDEDDSITYRCNTGYCLHGNATAYCRHSGWTHPPTCRPGCPTRDAPSYGSYVRSRAKYCPGQRAQFQCNTHFRLHGSEYSTCGSSGSWDSDVPRCRRVCGAPRTLRHGSTTSNKTSYSEGEYVDYTCNPGYCSYGDRRVYCRHNGFTDLPTCRKQCPHRDGPSYGSYVGSATSWCPGRRARYQCNPTFRMVGQEYSRCQTDGTWEHAVPVCRKICSHPSAPAYGYSTSTERSEYSENDSINYRCIPGYCMRGNPTIYCRHNGWTARPVCAAGCKPRDAPSYGSYVQHHDHYCPGQRAQFQCNRHFRLHGSEYSTCGSSGSWDSDVPRCRRVCGAASSLRYGSTTTNQTSYMEGEYVDYKCNSGYCMNGNPRVYCRHGGFTGLPTCRRACRHRSPPSYGSYYGNNTSWCPGQTARYRCNNKFYMVGEEYARCGNDGSWNHRVPECRRRCYRPNNPTYGYITSTPRSRSTYNQGDHITYGCDPGYCLTGDARATCEHSGWTHSPTCRRGCKHRNGPSYGGIYGRKQHWCPGDKAGFFCDQNFRLYGQANATCDHDGSWNHDVPRCRRVCARPSNPAYGSIRNPKSSYDENEYVTYTCNSGYCLAGDARAYCRHQGWTHVPQCRRGCPQVRAPAYGTVSSSKSHYCPGDRVSFKCRDGYQMSGHASSTCSNSYSWDYDAPTCIKKCKTPPAPTHGYIASRSSRPRTTYSLDDHVTVGCNTGYCGGGSMYCRHSGWDTSVTCRHGCPSRDPPAHGIYTGSKRYWCPGDRATYKCKYGWELHGSGTTTCNSNYEWDRAVPQCRRVCHLPQAPAHGSFHYDSSRSTKFHEGGWISVRCYDGYKLVGDSRVYCRSSGWTSIPTCTRLAPTHPPGYGHHQSSSCKNKCGVTNVGGCSCGHACVNRYNCCPDFQQFCGSYVRQPSSRYGLHH